MTLSDEEKKKAARERNKKYRKTSKYKRTNRKWRKKPEVKAKRKEQALIRSRKSEVKADAKKRMEDPKVRAERKVWELDYFRKPKVRSRLKKQKREYSQMPERKIQRKKVAAAHKLVALTAILKKTTNSKVLYCVCCRVKGIAFLTLDHIDPDGRKKMGHLGWSADKLYIWVERKVQQGVVPDGLQVLCFNCNIAKGQGAKCPGAGKSWHIQK